MKNVLSQDVDPSKFEPEQSPDQLVPPTQDDKAIDAANKLKLMFPARQPAN
jgi:hypothetical protein